MSGLTIGNTSLKSARKANPFKDKSSKNKPSNSDGESDKAASSVTFIQNNNSPKALKRIDIYRQTKNQIAMLKKGGPVYDMLN